MTKLDLVLERIRQLPPEKQDSVVAEIDTLLDDAEHGVSLLTDEQWAEVEAALADSHEPTAAHADVFARLPK